MEKTKLYINDEYCLSLEQLKGYFAQEIKPETRLYDELLDLQRDGTLAKWLAEGGDKEKALSTEVEQLMDCSSDIELMNQLVKVFTGESGNIAKPRVFDYLEFKGINCKSNGKEIILTQKKWDYNGGFFRNLWNGLSEMASHVFKGDVYQGDVVLPLSENDDIASEFVTIALSFKVKKRGNEQFCIQMKSEGLVHHSCYLNCNEHKKDTIVTIEFPAAKLTESRTFRFTWDNITPTFVTVEIEAVHERMTFVDNGVSFNMIYVEGGKFLMGATEDDKDASTSERPRHEVLLSGCYIGETLVTQALWQAVMGTNPSYRREGDDYPVEWVSWDNCQDFIRKLNEITGRKFRLPTEAEWEFAARGGNKSHGYKYAGSNNIDEVAWCGGVTHLVATKLSNELGIYDMSGNVNEWCEDWYSNYSKESQINPVGPATGTYRIFRGGSKDLKKYCRITSRSCATPSVRSTDRGFRLAL